MTTGLKSPAMSFSQSNALKCGFFFRQHYLLGGRDLPEAGGVFLRGSLYHDIIAQYTAHLLERSRDTDYDELYAIAGRVCDGAMPEIQDDVAELVDLTRDHFIKPPWASKDNTRLERKLGIQEITPGQFVGCDFDSPSAFFRARLDIYALLDDRMIFDDYKTSWQIETESQAQKSFQLRCYAWVLSVLRPDIDLFEGGFRYPRAKFYGVSVQFTRDDLVGIPDEIRTHIRRRADIIEKSDWSARPVKRLCSICSYDCPLRKSDAQFTIAPTTPDGAVKLADRLEWLTLEKDNIRELLKDYAADHGVVGSSSGQYFGWYPQKSLELTEEAIEIIRESDPSLLVASASAIKSKLEAKSRAELREELGDFLRETTKSRFYGIIPKEDGE